MSNFTQRVAYWASFFAINSLVVHRTVGDLPWGTPEFAKEFVVLLIIMVLVITGLQRVLKTDGFKPNK